jgi:hypothetical protein
MSDRSVIVFRRFRKWSCEGDTILDISPLCASLTLNRFKSEFRAGDIAKPACPSWRARLWRVLKGVSTRSFKGLFSGAGKEIGLRKSSDSRQTAAAAEESLKTLAGRRIKAYQFAIMIDEPNFARAIDQAAGERVGVERPDRLPFAVLRDEPGHPPATRLARPSSLRLDPNRLLQGPSLAVAEAFVGALLAIVSSSAGMGGRPVVPRTSPAVPHEVSLRWCPALLLPSGRFEENSAPPRSSLRANLETSLHPDLIRPLAKLIADSSAGSQHLSLCRFWMRRPHHRLKAS